MLESAALNSTMRERALGLLKKSLWERTAKQTVVACTNEWSASKVGL